MVINVSYVIIIEFVGDIYSILHPGLKKYCPERLTKYTSKRYTTDCRPTSSLPCITLFFIPNLIMAVFLTVSLHLILCT